MKKTRNGGINKPYIISCIVLMIMMIAFVLIFIVSFLDFQKQVNFLNVSWMMISVFLFVFALLSVVSHLFGKRKVQRRVKKNQKEIKKTNPYIYYRELPNPYGVGIASLLMDSTLENEKDIVAIILNLCAKKYLSLKKENDYYTIFVLKEIDSKLLSNEKYIMSCILNQSLNELNYEEWFSYCMNDGINLGLFTQNELYDLKNVRASNGFSLSIKMAGRGGYNSKMIQYLEPTSLGKEEIQKLYSFEKFLKDFGNFASKNPEEIVLWDYYLCYAQVFGLTDKMIKSGYDKLVRNSSFEIDNLSSIHLDQINIILK